MSTIKGQTYSSPKNINLKEGILRFDVQKSSNPLSLDSGGWGLYVDSSDQLVFWNGTGISVLGSGGGGSTPTWETLFGADNTFTITPDATFTIAGNRSTATDVLTLTNAAGGSGSVLQITNSGSGHDIDGTSNSWSVTKAGVITATGLTLSGANTITTTGGDITWTLEDNDATALKIGASGATSIINIITTNGSEAVVFGNNMTLTDGLFTATSTSNTAPLFLLQNDTITTFGNGTTEDQGAFVFSSDTLTTGDLIRLQLDESALVGGAFLKCVQTDGATAVFTIGEAGATVIAGDASGTDALTITAGDLTLTSGDVTMTAGDLLLTLGNATLTAGDLTLTLGDFTVTAGNIVNTLGDLTLTAGDFTMTVGDMTMVDGSITMEDADNASSFVLVNDTITTADLVDISSASISDGSLMKLNANAAAHDGTVLELISAGDATSTATGMTVTIADVTTGVATGIDVTMVKATTQAIGIKVTMDAITTGSMLYLDNGGDSLTSGYFINCNDDASPLFSVGANGATVIAGDASGTDALTLTAGDLTLTSGDVTMTAGDLLLTLGNLTLTAGNIVNTLGDLTLTAGDLLLSSGTLTMTSGNATLTAGNLILTAGTIIETAQAILNANTAISITHGVTKIANNAASSHTLADGVEGQRKTIICTVYVGDAVITPDNLANGSTLTLNAVGDACTLVFLGTEWWVETLYGTAALA